MTQTLTPEQEESAMAWATVFGDGAATQRVFDEAVQFVRTMDPNERAGATFLLIWAMSKRSQLRRSKQAEKKGRTKT